MTKNNFRLSVKKLSPDTKNIKNRWGRTINNIFCGDDLISNKKGEFNSFFGIRSCKVFYTLSILENK